MPIGYSMRVMMLGLAIHSRHINTCKLHVLARQKQGVIWSEQPNTGISAVIDQRGKLVATIPQFAADVMQAKVPRLSRGNALCVITRLAFNANKSLCHKLGSVAAEMALTRSIGYSAFLT